MKTEEIQQLLPNVMLFTSHKNDFEIIKAFIEAPPLDIELVRKLRLESREREELDLIRRVRKIIESNQ